MNKATLRFYGELNDLLPKERRQTPISYSFSGNPGIKDGIEALGIPHPLIFLILVNGRQVDFSHRLRSGDYVSLYPPFRTLPVHDEMGLLLQYQEEVRFILDDHLGRLARYLRQLGFDTLYGKTFQDEEVLHLAEEERRIILTKDSRLLRHKRVRFAYLIVSNDPKDQLLEVLQQYDLFASFHPFGRCLLCNHKLKAVKKEDILHRLEPLTRKYYQEFFWCSACEKVYWKGSHYQRMISFLDSL